MLVCVGDCGRAGCPCNQLSKCELKENSRACAGC